VVPPKEDRLFEEEQRLFRQQLARFVQREIRTRADEWGQQGEISF
jgi:hypothetical protein